jgi:2-(3-amino-3-carboxypropyl)histidine synthase
LYQLEIERVTEEVKKRNARRILLQLPDGIRSIAYKIVNAIIISTGAQVFVSGDSCYGACDIAINQAKELDIDLIIHYGHSEMVTYDDIPILFVHLKIDIDVKSMMDAAEEKIKDWNKIGVVTTIQHIHQIEDIENEIKNRGYLPILSTGLGKTPLFGQILGCYLIGAQDIAKDVDGFLYLGGGSFHPIGLIMSTSKPVILVNPFTKKISNMAEKDIFQIAKKRTASIEAAKKAKKIGILVSSKPGQRDIKTALKLENKFRKRNVNTIIIYLNEVKAEHLNNFTEPEVFLNTGCPRISIDGVEGIKKPILTVNEALIVLGEKSWEGLWGKGYFNY